MSYNKDPDSVLDFTVDWSRWLPSGDTINTSTWIVPTGMNLDSSSHTSDKAVAWLSGGTIDHVYKIQNAINTVGGRTENYTITIYIAQH